MVSDSFLEFFFCCIFPFLFVAMSDEHPINPTAPTENSCSFAGNSSSITQSVLENHANLYYLHHYDNTSLVIVFDLLTENNYTSWSRSMIIALIVKNKMGFVDGSLSQPLRHQLSSWKICNNVVIA